MIAQLSQNRVAYDCEERESQVYEDLIPDVVLYCTAWVWRLALSSCGPAGREPVSCGWVGVLHRAAGSLRDRAVPVRVEI